MVFFIVLRAIVEDSPTVPTLLTDYILKGAFISYFLFVFGIKSLLLITFMEFSVLCPT